MSEHFAPPPSPPAAAEAAPTPPPATRWIEVGDLRFGVVVVLALAVLGAVLGVIWYWWSPAGPLGFVVAPHAIQPDEVETYAATDGRFAVIAAAAGLASGAVLWLWRSSRGPATAAALAVGGLAGAACTDLVGRALDHGTTQGAVGTVIRNLPLRVHSDALLLVEPMIALLLYSVLAAFASADDLGRGSGASVAVGDELQH